ncbi:MAG: 4Fe-4S binding protein, partial [Candidatus Omnitrophica bacterium]|nr:4Fe-4S binding protein [Candidatus Omnitrophota bacterium]
MKKLVWVRRSSQVLFLLLFVYILWSTTYPLKGLISPEIIFKIDPLIVFLTSLSERVLLPGLLFSLGMILMTVVFGRFFCGWVCPLGTLIDWTGASGLSKRELRDKTNARIRKIKYFILALVTVFAVCGVQIAWVFDPLVIMARFVSLNFIPTVTLAFDKMFIALIQHFNLYGTFYDFYRALKSTLLGVNAYYFSNSAAIFVFFLAIIASTLLLSRLWCRTLCPLGALYALTAKLAFLERKVTGCLRCGICKSDCRTGAIREDTGYAKGECVVCMDCLYDCPAGATSFQWRLRSTKAKQVTSSAKGISRKDFIFLLSSALLLSGFKNRFRWMKGRTNSFTGSVIRPPGALKENNFLERCIRCGNCMKVCITNGLQPVTLESGMEGVWT